MSNEEIINLWKKGYSRKFIYNEEFKILFNRDYIGVTGRYKKIKEIKEEARANVERVLLEWYRKEVSYNDKC